MAGLVKSFLTWLCIFANILCLLLTSWIVYLYVNGKSDPMSAALGGVYLSVFCCLVYFGCFLIKGRLEIKERKVRDTVLHWLTIVCAFLVPFWFFAIVFHRSIFFYIQNL